MYFNNTTTDILDISCIATELNLTEHTGIEQSTIQTTKLSSIMSTSIMAF